MKNNVNVKFSSRLTEAQLEAVIVRTLWNYRWPNSKETGINFSDISYVSLNHLVPSAIVKFDEREFVFMLYDDCFVVEANLEKDNDIAIHLSNKSLQKRYIKVMGHMFGKPYRDYYKNVLTKKQKQNDIEKSL